MGFTKMSHSYEMLFLGRFIIGVNCGLNTSLVPMYISEIAPLNLRGGLGTVNQLAVTVGLLLSQVLGIEPILGTNDGWPILLGLAICPAVLQLLLLPICPESPRYLLITKQWEEEARKGGFLGTPPEDFDFSNFIALLQHFVACEPRTMWRRTSRRCAPKNVLNSQRAIYRQWS